MKINSTTFVPVSHLIAALALLLTLGSSRAASISCGQTVTNTTTSNAEVDVYTFSGSAGQKISFAFSWGCNNAGTAEIHDPGGDVVTNLTTGCSGIAANLTLARSGNYQIWVHDSEYSGVNSYSLSVQSVSGGGCDSAPIACGETLATNTLYNTEMDAYGYAGTAGQMLTFALSWGCNNAGTADIYDPSGNWVTNLTTGCSGTAIRLTLATTGTYTLLVHDSQYSGVNSYSLSIQSTTGGGCSGKSIACGETAVATMVYSTEMDAYSYAGTAGQMLIFALSWGCNNAGTADIYDPSGNWVTNLSTGCSGTAIPLTLASTGIYTVLVHNSQYSDPNSYSFSAQSVTGGGCNSTPLACGETLSGNTTYSTEMDAYSYAGTVGQTVSFALSWGCNNAGTVDIYDPSGNWVTNLSAGCGGAAIELTLARTGNYTLLVHDSQYSGINSYSLSDTVLGGCASMGLNFAVGETQQDICLPMEIADSAPPGTVSFDVAVPYGVLTNPMVAVAPPFTNAIVTQLSSSEWSVTMQATNVDSADQFIGSICFLANATQSQFVQIMLSNLTISNQDGSVPGTMTAGGEAVIIANQPLLQAQLTNGQRFLTIYGKANTNYIIDYSTNLNGGWSPAWTNTVPPSMVLSSPVQGPASNAPALFLRAHEQ